MNNIRVYIDDNNEVIGYSAGNTGYPSIEVIQDNPIFDPTKLQGYKIENQDGEYHLSFDQEKYDRYIEQTIKDKAVVEGEKNQLI